MHPQRDEEPFAEIGPEAAEAVNRAREESLRSSGQVSWWDLLFLLFLIP